MNFVKTVLKMKNALLHILVSWKQALIYIMQLILLHAFAILHNKHISLNTKKIRSTIMAYLCKKMKECSNETKIYYKCLKIIVKDHSNWSVIINNTDISGYFNLLMNDMNTKNFTKLILKESDHDELGIIRKYMMHLITNSDIIHDTGYLAYNNEFEFFDFVDSG